MSKYDFFRRRVLPLAMVVVFGLLTYETCNKHERTQATLVFTYGVFEKDVQYVEAEVWMNDEYVTTLKRQALDGAYIGTTRFQLSLPDTSGEIRISLDLTGGVRKQVTRRLHVREGDTVTFDLERDLR